MATVRRLRRFEVVDRQGFSRPVVSMTGVMPSDWDLVASDVAYGGRGCCPALSLTTSFRLSSADRHVGMELFPATYSVWFDDRTAEVMYGASPIAGGSCERSAVMDGPVYVRHRLLPRYRSGGVVVSVEPVPALAEALERRTRRVAGRSTTLKALRVDVSLVRVTYPQHRTEERFLVPTVHEGQSFDMRAVGPPQQWASYRPFIVGMWSPEGEWEQHRPSYELVVGSLMQEPDWLEKQAQLSVATGRLLTRAARDRRIVWDATVDLANPTLLGALRNRETGAGVFDITLWSGSGHRYALDGSVRRAWTTPGGELVVADDAACEAPEEGLRPLRPGPVLLPGETPGTGDHDGETRLAAPRGGTLSAPSAGSGVAGAPETGGDRVEPPVRSMLHPPEQTVVVQPAGQPTPDDAD